MEEIPPSPARLSLFGAFAGSLLGQLEPTGMGPVEVFFVFPDQREDLTELRGEVC